MRPVRSAVTVRLERCPSAPLECPPCALAFSLARCGICDLPQHRGERFGAGTCGLEFCEDRVMVGGIDEFPLSILADADARLRSLDAPAAYALPRGDSLSHLEPIL